MATPDDYDQTSLTRAVERLAQLGHAAALARAASDRPDAFQARGRDPAEYPPLAREEALEQLALSEGVRRRLARRRQVDVRDARVVGASWSEIGEALGVSKQAAHEAHTRWIAEQADQYARLERETGHGIGLSPAEAERARGLAGDAP